MIERDAIRDAVAAGILQPEQGERLAAFLAQRASAQIPSQNLAADPDDEKFRLVSGFNDIFVSMAILIAFAGIATLSGNILMSSVVIAAASWGLAEIFTLRRRMALPSIVLALGFGICIAALAILSLGGMARGGPTVAMVPALLIAAAAVYGHFRRFRVAIDLAIAGGLAAGAAYIAIRLAVPDSAALRSILIVACGLALFALAMRYDLRDLQRATLNADIAFWLHLIAAPLIVHGLVGELWQFWRSGATPASLGIFWSVIGICFLTGILTDRRAIIVSTLGYLIAAFFYMFGGRFGLPAAPVSAGLLFIGVLLLSLSIWWRPIRATSLRFIPFGPLKQYLPPPRHL